MSNKTIDEIFKSMTDEQQQACYAMIGAAIEDSGVEMAHSGMDDDEAGELTDDELDAIVDFIIEEGSDDEDDEDDDEDDMEHSDAELKHFGVPGMKWGKRKAGGVTTSGSNKKSLKKAANQKFQDGLKELAKSGRKNDTKAIVKLQLQLAKELKEAKQAGKKEKPVKVSYKKEAYKNFQEGLVKLSNSGRGNDHEAIKKLSEQYDKELKAGKIKAKEAKKMKHSDVTNQIFADAKKVGSLKDAYLMHAATYGVAEIEQLFPNAKAVSNKPSFINNNVEWVNKILGGVNQLPFARVKSLFADISPETVRAKGYVKGNLKEEDVFSLMKRITEPYTVYKKGKMDRDDVVDITDFDVVSWIKEAMRMKLDEEIARAILLGDGRLAVDNDKIDEECIRPIVSDADLFTIKVPLGDETNKYVAFINAVTRARKDYRGSGNPTLYTTEDLISELLLLEDTTGRRLYKSLDELKSLLRVSDIVTLSDMIGLTRETLDEANVYNVMGIIVNISDYSVGSDKGGKVSMFDDFDIDYNQQKFLIETRCSGALTVPYSAMVIEDVVPVVPAP